MGLMKKIHNQQLEEPFEILKYFHSDLQSLRIDVNKNRKWYKRIKTQEKNDFIRSIKLIKNKADSILNNFKNTKKNFSRNFPKTFQSLEENVGKIKSTFHIMEIDAKQISDYDSFVILGSTLLSLNEKIRKLNLQIRIYLELMKK